MNKLKWLGIGMCFAASLALMLFMMFAALSKLPLEPTKGPHHYRQPKYRGYR